MNFVSAEQLGCPLEAIDGPAAAKSPSEKTVLEKRRGREVEGGREKKIREKGQGLRTNIQPGYRRHSTRQHSISPKMFFVVHRLPLPLADVRTSQPAVLYRRN